MTLAQNACELTLFPGSQELFEDLFSFDGGPHSVAARTQRRAARGERAHGRNRAQNHLWLVAIDLLPNLADPGT